MLTFTTDEDDVDEVVDYNISGAESKITSLLPLISETSICTTLMTLIPRIYDFLPLAH